MKEQIIQNLLNISIFLAIIIASFILAYIIDRLFKRYLTKQSVIMKSDPTRYTFLRHLVRAIIYLAGFGLAVYAMPSLRALASSLLAGASILALAVGFASQAALSNIVGGLFIVIFKPFHINDRLKIKTDIEGIVEDITLRHTVIRDFENKRIVIPNSVISSEVIVNSNLVEDKICKFIDFSISFDSDIQKAKSIMVEEVLKHPLHIDVRTPEQIEAGDPEAVARVIAIGDFAVRLRTWAWAATSPDGFVLACDLLENIKLRFGEEGIEIPYPHWKVIK